MIRKIEYECGQCGHRFLVTGDEKGPSDLPVCPLCNCSRNTWISECRVRQGTRKGGDNESLHETKKGGESIMHYKNGREAQVGDRIVGQDINGNPVAGVLVDAIPGSDTCNGYILPSKEISQAQLISVKDCLHVDDFKELTSVAE